jgi:hypothetical protein
VVPLRLFAATDTLHPFGFVVAIVVPVPLIGKES